MLHGNVSRRGFLGDVAAAAAAFSAGMAAVGRAQEKKEAKDLRPVKFAFIGTGSQGCFDLKQALKNPACQCVAVCDINPANLAAGAAAAKADRTYADYHEMLAKEKDVEAVAIAVPLWAHAQITLDCLDAGKHVFCEKALAHSVDQCKAVCRKAKATGKFVQVGHQRRYSPLYGHAAKLIKKDKVLGQLTTMRAYWHRNRDWARPLPKDPPKADYKKWGYDTPDQLINWRLYTKYSGGLMAELAGHQLDVVNWMIEMTPVRIVGIGGLDWYDWAKHGRDVYDNVQCVFEYPGGIKLVYSSIATNEYDGYGEEFMGRDGTLIVERCTNGLLYRERRAVAQEWMKKADKTKVGKKSAITLDAGATAQTGMGGKQTGGKAMTKKKRSHREDYVDEFASFFDCIRTGKRPFCSEIEGMQSAVTIIKANEAMRTNASVELTPDLYKI